MLMGSWSDHVRSWTGWKHTPMILLRYEDMLADAFGQLGMVARKLGIARDEARIRRAVEFSSFKALQAQEAQSGFIEKSLHSRRFFRAGRAGGWREVLAPAPAAMMERNTPEPMRRFGLLPPPAPDTQASCPERPHPGL